MHISFLYLSQSPSSEGAIVEVFRFEILPCELVRRKTSYANDVLQIDSRHVNQQVLDMIDNLNTNGKAFVEATELRKRKESHKNYGLVLFLSCLRNNCAYA